MARRHTGHDLPRNAPILRRVEAVRVACREHRRANGEWVWEPPERFLDGTVRGWRTWNVGRFAIGARLVPFNGFPAVAWSPVERATCLLECGDLMHPSCSCGLYAWSDFAVCWAEFEHRVEEGWPPKRPLRVIGEVCGWGRINLHDDGWRSEFAMVRRLWTADLTPEQDAQLGRHYGVTVADFADLFEEQGLTTR